MVVGVSAGVTDIDAADEADLARWFKNDDDFRAWLDAHDAWKEDLLATIVIERPAKEEPDPDDEDLSGLLAGRSDESGRRDLDYLFSEHHGSDAEATAMLAELVKFIEREGHTDVPYDYWFVDAAGVERPLYNWVCDVREKFQHDTLSAELITALDGIDAWEWSLKLDQWCTVLNDFQRADARSYEVLRELTPLGMFNPQAKTLRKQASTSVSHENECGSCATPLPKSSTGFQK